jgi:hypothetical protein
MLDRIFHNEIELAIIIRAGFSEQGISFFTSNDYSQQLGYMNRPAGYLIPPHRHNAVDRKVVLTQEVLYIRKGKIRVDFYDDFEKYLQSAILETGDVILLAAGGHGFEMIEDSEIIEVKQGPYAAEQDKVRFAPISQKQINLL